jgi:peptidoglycan/LPS O-acetylase OafA/YrhL
MGIYWNPLCWLPEFTLGIYLIKRGFYPKKQSSRALAFLGNLSFYIYLINQPIMQSFHLAENIPLFGAVLFGFSVLLYLLDKKIQTLISRRLKKPKPPSALQ